MSKFQPQHRPPKTKLTIALIVIYLVWGSTYLAIRYAIETIPPFLMAGTRFLLAGGLLFGYLKLKGHGNPTRRHWKSAFVVGTLLLLGGNGLVGWAEQTVESGLAALMVSVAPLWMAFFEMVGPERRRIRPMVAAGLILGFVGVALLIGPRIYRFGFYHSAGFMALILAPILWAMGSVQSKRWPFPSSAFMITAMQMMAGGFVLFIIAATFGPYKSIFSVFRRKKQLQIIRLRENILRAAYYFHERENEPVSVLNLMSRSTENRDVPAARKVLRDFLKEEIFVEKSPGQYLLTDLGETLALNMVRKHRIWETFVVEKLGVNPDRAHDNAEIFEHYITEDILSDIQKELSATEDPHGQKIPPLKVEQKGEQK